MKNQEVDVALHEIFVSGKRVSCTCQYYKETLNYTEARKLAEKHAASFKPFIIKPLASN